MLFLAAQTIGITGTVVNLGGNIHHKTTKFLDDFSIYLMTMQLFFVQSWVMPNMVI